MRRDTIKRVGIVGLGYLGLPLAVAFAEAGFEVIGIDNDAGKVTAINAGESHVEDVSPDDLKPLTQAGRLRVARGFESVAASDAVLLCVPTLLDENRTPDLSAVEAAIRGVADHLKPGALVILESTTYPGTTREVVLPILERGGRRVGKDFFLAFSPDRPRQPGAHHPEHTEGGGRDDPGVH